MADDVFEVAITDIAYGGDGVGHLPDGMAVFVPFTAVGDVARVRVVERQRSYGRGELLGLVQAGPERVEPVCAVYGRCGGCRYQHLSGREQWERKKVQLAASLARLGGVEGVPEVESPGPAAVGYGYRSKLSLHLTGSDLPEEALAYHSVDGQSLVPVTACPLGHGELNELLGEMIASGSYRELGSAQREDPVVLRRDGTGQVIHYRRPPGMRLTETVLGRKLVSPAGGFHQVNAPVLEQLAVWLREVAAADAPDALVDLYCGSGLFSVLLGDLARLEVLGVDSHPASVKAAQENVRKTGVERMHFEAGRTEDHADALLKRGGKKGTVLAIVDPPRQGCHKLVTRALLEQAPDRIFYVSCNPTTLARDLQRLEVGSRYRLERLAMFDMFPQTAHLESVAVLRRMGPPPERKMHKLAKGQEEQEGQEGQEGA